MHVLHSSSFRTDAFGRYVCRAYVHEGPTEQWRKVDRRNGSRFILRYLKNRRNRRLSETRFWRWRFSRQQTIYLCDARLDAARNRTTRYATRKLIYIEPSPERLALDPASPRSKPDAIAHSLAAMVELPRYETIREDIDLILDRNHLLERIDELTRRVDHDVHSFQEKVIQSGAAEKFESIPSKNISKSLASPMGPTTGSR